MNWQKNRFSYFLWLIYTTIVGVGILGVASVICTRMGYISDYGLLVGGGYLICAGMFALGMRKILIKKKFAGVPDDLSTLVKEGVIAILLFAAGIALRVVGLCHFTGLGESEYFYETALVTGQEVPLHVHGTTYVYLLFLRAVLTVFGNKILAALWLQIILQLIGAVILYLAVRKLAGRLAALIMEGFLMLSPFMIEKALTTSPAALFMAVYGIALYGIAFTISDRVCPKWRFPVVGAAIGLCCYLDVTGITLLVIAAGVFTIDRDEEVKTENKRVEIFLGYLLGCLLGIALLFILDAVLCNKSVINIICAWGRIYKPDGFVFAATLYQMFLEADGIILIAMLAIGIFCYGRREEYERQGIWLGATLVLILLQCLQMMVPAVDSSVYFYTLLAILAGVGIEGIFIMDNVPKHFVDEMEDKLMKEVELLKEKEAHTALESVEENPETDLIIENLKQVEKGNAEGKNNEQATVQKALTEVVREMIPEENQTKESDTKENHADEKKQVKYLDNPLPLPKKHVPKVMDYRVGNVDMENDYDIEVSDDDDFDI